MSSSLIRRVAAPLVASALLVTSACAVVGGQMTAPVKHTVVTAGKGAKPEKSLPSDKEGKPGQLLGPHFRLAVSGYTATGEVPEDKVDAYGLDEPMAAPEGSEFFLAFMDENSEVKSGEDVTAKLLVDGEKRDLSRLPDSGEAIAAVVPAKAAVELSVTDEKRTQSINLRDGERGEQIDGYYNARLETADPKDYQAKGKVTADAGSRYEKEQRTLDIDMKVDAAARSPWLAEGGWAGDGKVWVTVPVSEMTTNAVWGFKKGSHQPGVNWTLKEADLFSLNPDPGKKTDSKGDTTFKANQDSKTSDGKTSLFAPSDVVLKFQIPDDAAKAELKITPGGKLKAVWANTDGSASWDDKPSSGKIKLTF